MDDLRNQLINGRYRVSEELGIGGMAQVCLARDLRLGRDVILKLVRIELLASSEGTSVREQFLHEANLMLRLRHPNLEAIYEYGEYQGRPFMVLEPLLNSSLSRRMHEFHDHQSAATLLAVIADGLQHMHDLRIVHCDVKPDNILFDANDVPKLADFGIARLLPQPRQTQEPEDQQPPPFVQGTPQYMAPELWFNQPCPQSDQYALGVTLYELLTREWPFSGTSALETGEEHLNRPIPLPSALLPDLPPEVDAVIGCLLAKQPQDRYTTMADAARALRMLADVPLSEGEKERRKSLIHQKQRRRWWRWLLLSAAVLLLVGVIVTILLVW